MRSTRLLCDYLYKCAATRLFRTKVPPDAQNSSHEWNYQIMCGIYVDGFVMYACTAAGPRKTRMDFHSNLRNIISSNRVRGCACVSVWRSFPIEAPPPINPLKSTAWRNRTSVRARIRDIIYARVLHVLCVRRNVTVRCTVSRVVYVWVCDGNSAHAVRCGRDVKLSRWQRGSVGGRKVVRSVGRCVRAVRVCINRRAPRGQPLLLILAPSLTEQCL